MYIDLPFEVDAIQTRQNKKAGMMAHFRKKKKHNSNLTHYNTGLAFSSKTSDFCFNA